MKSEIYSPSVYEEKLKISLVEHSSRQLLFFDVCVIRVILFGSVMHTSVPVFLCDHFTVLHILHFMLFAIGERE